MEKLYVIESPESVFSPNPVFSASAGSLLLKSVTIFKPSDFYSRIIMIMFIMLMNRNFWLFNESSGIGINSISIDSTPA